MARFRISWRLGFIVVVAICLAKADSVPSDSVAVSQSLLPRVAGYLAVGLVALACLEQMYLFYWKGSHPGPVVSWPFVGSTIYMLRHPYVFWQKQLALAAKTGISWNYIGGKFTLLIVKAKQARLPFMKNSATDFVPSLHPNAKAVFGEKGVMFLSGPEHKEIRASFLHLFTRSAISSYVETQEKVAREYVQLWKQKAGKMFDLRDHLVEFNAKSSREIFVGPYLEDPKQFQEYMITIGKGFVSMPLNIPGGGLWNTHRARKKAEQVLLPIVKRSKDNMRKGVTPCCLMDFWSKRILEDTAKAEESGQTLPAIADDFQMALIVLDFLFAGQDASTAGLAQAVALLSDYPDVFQKVREEQQRINPNKEPISYTLLMEMKYTRQVALEILRFRPPLPIFAHKPTRDMDIGEGCIAPKGSLVFSSIASVCRQGFTDPDVFDPDRFSEERKEDVKYGANYLVFGAGPHKCAGREYVVNNMTVFLAVLCTEATWKRTKTPKSDEAEYRPTAYPADLLVTFD